MKAEATVEHDIQPTWLRKFAWKILVVVVPILAAALMIGVALQIVGVPVWQTTKVYLGLAHATDASEASQLQSQLALEQAKDKALTAQLTQLNQQLTSEQQKNENLQGQVQQLQDMLSAKQDSLAHAKKEAAVLAGMDPSAGANLLAKMSIQEAAQVVAQMSTDVSGQILAELDAAKAAQILSMAAQIETSTASDNNVGNSDGANPTANSAN
jgi:flagellar motility protein MotE (MotC chaperone)